MQVGIDSYSYHRRYGEVARRARRRRRTRRGRSEPGPVLRHAGATGRPTCLPRDLLPARARGHRRRPAGRRRPRPARSASRGAIPGRPAGSTASTAAARYGAEIELARWIDDGRAARSGRPAHHRRQPGIARRRAGRGPRRAARRRRPVARPTARPDRGIRLALENHGDLRVAGHPRAVRAGRPAGRRSASASTTSTSSGSATTWPRAPRRSRRTRCWSSSRTTSPATRRCGAARCARPSARASPTSTGSSRSSTRPGFDGPVCVELASLGRDRRRRARDDRAQRRDGCAITSPRTRP